MISTLERLVEIRGDRRSGKSTKLNKLFFEALKENDGFCLIIGTDIRMSDVNEVFGSEEIPDLAIITPTFREVYCIVKGIFGRYKLTDFLKMYGDIQEVRLFVDNITLENSKYVYDQVKDHGDIVELYYTSLHRYRKEALKNLLYLKQYDLDDETELVRINVSNKEGVYTSNEEIIEHGGKP